MARSLAISETIELKFYGLAIIRIAVKRFIDIFRKTNTPKQGARAERACGQYLRTRLRRFDSCFMKRWGSPQRKTAPSSRVGPSWDHYPGLHSGPKERSSDDYSSVGSGSVRLWGRAELSPYDNKVTAGTVFRGRPFFISTKPVSGSPIVRSFRWLWWFPHRPSCGAS